MKRKIFFGVYKLKNIIINSLIVLLLAVIATVAFIGGNDAVVTNTVNGAYYSGSRASNNVSLMVNVYWGEEYLDDMLKIMEEKGVKSTFFIGGMWMLENEEMVKKINDAGHEIANHGYKHKDQDKLSEEDAKNEIMTTHNLVQKMLKKDMNLFAPPSGAYNAESVKIAESLGYKTIMWTRDTIDWRDHNTELIYKRATDKLQGGDLILMHPTQNTVEALSKIIDYAQNKGFKVTTVSDCIG